MNRHSPVASILNLRAFFIPLCPVSQINESEYRTMLSDIKALHVVFNRISDMCRDSLTRMIFSEPLSLILGLC